MGKYGRIVSLVEGKENRQLQEQAVGPPTDDKRDKLIINSARGHTD